MLPKWHVFYGALFTLLLWYVAPNVGWINLTCVFFASFLIDLDHYISAVMYNKSLSIKSALMHYDEVSRKIESDNKRGIRHKEPHFHVFHTIEFHLLIALMGFLYTPFFYIFIGMTFHSLLDVYYLMSEGYLYIREYFFFNWLAKKF